MSQNNKNKTTALTVPLAKDQHWSTGRKRETGMRILRGESVEILSRKLSIGIKGVGAAARQSPGGKQLIHGIRADLEVSAFKGKPAARSGPGFGFAMESGSRARGVDG